MSTQLQDSNEPTPATPKDAVRQRVIAGFALIAIGAIVFLAQITKNAELSWLVVPALGVIFLIWGLMTREVGFLIPGGILSGLGAGLYLMFGPLAGHSGNEQAGALMLCFAAGWALITLLSPLTKQRFQWWPLIPGAIIALVGVALLGGGAAMQILQVLGYAWPLALVGIGIYLLVKRRHA